MDRIDKILTLASESVFYTDGEGTYRINYTLFGDGSEEGEDVYFDVVDEDTGEEFRVFPEDVCNGHIFYKTISVVVSDE